MIAPVVLAATAAFNLVCSGTAYNVLRLMGPQENKHNFEEVYRVDLDARRWCSGDCTATSEIAKLSDIVIVFRLEERGTLNDTVTLVNRESGTFTDRTRFEATMSFAQGQCRKAPFTGFPARKF